MIIVELTKEEIKQIIKEEISSALASQGPNAVDELLTRKDTAKYLGVTMPTLNSWEKKGYIKAKRLGSRVYFYKSKLLKNER